MITIVRTHTQTVMLWARLVLLEQQNDIVRNQFSAEEHMSRNKKNK